MANPVTLDSDSAPLVAVPHRARAGAGAGPVVIEVRGLEKTFRIPEHRVDTLKERITQPFARTGYRDLHALRDISFDVHKGEFFGIVGRNGSGKSTLLKILASIYRADAGRVRMAGRMAPFIELGVGFNPELTARENVALNGVLFGLSRRDAAQRLDAVLDFAELRDFVDLKIKNYSSGMMVRLAFSIMVQADADIMLIDEVLAVGDAAFGQKCMDVFFERRRLGRTVVLVTHDMATVQSLCHRAMVIHDGDLQYVGDPEDAAMHYYRLNFAGSPAEADANAARPPDDTDAVVALNARLVQARLLDEAGEPIQNVEQGAPIIVDIEIEAARELVDPIFRLHVLNEDGLVVFGFERQLDGRLVAGQRVRLAGQIENPLVPGRYSLDCWIRRDRQGGDMALQGLRVTKFVVYGTAPRHGIVSLRTRHRGAARAASRTMNTETGDLILRDVPGPSALGGGWRRSLELLYLIAVTEFKRTYFGTVLGYLWSLARPLLLFAVLVTVFTKLIRLTSVPHYSVVLLMNIVLFGFFQEATLTAVGSVVAQESIVRKTQFPRLVIPLSVVLTSVFNLLLNLIVVVDLHPRRRRHRRRGRGCCSRCYSRCCSASPSRSR